MTAHDGSRRRGAGSVEALLAALVAGHTVAAAADAAGMSESSARRKLKEPAVRKQLDELRHSTLAAAADRLAALALGATLVLGRVMNDTNVPASVRVRAAGTILARCVPVREAALVEDRLAELEAAWAAQKQAQQRRWSA